jgi:dienelactone hydrolase
MIALSECEIFKCSVIFTPFLGRNRVVVWGWVPAPTAIAGKIVSTPSIIEQPIMTTSQQNLLTKGSFMKPILLLALTSLPVWAGSTTVLFQPLSTNVGPFPSNALTTSDSTQITGLRVQLPASSQVCDTSSAPSVCSNTSLLNELDGFSVNPRLMVCFSGPIDTNTLQAGISIIPLGGGSTVSINQIIYDSNSNCAFAKPNQVLNQQRQYLLLVNGTVRDASGQPVTADPMFATCLATPSGYCSALSQAVKNSVKLPASLVAASLFTTMSATTWLEEARSYVDGSATAPASILATFALSNVANITWVPQDNTGTTAHQENVPVSALSGIGSIVFGTYLSPDFLFPLDGTIHTTPTAQGFPPPYFTVPISFHVFVPASPKPPNGYPVVIYGHGLADNQFGAPTYIASTLAQNGFVTLAFEIPGHGYGPGSVVNLTDLAGNVQSVPTPGRGVQLPGHTTIGPTDGCILPGAVAIRDCGRQTAVDLFALVKTIQVSPALNLDPTRIYYVGQSFGGTYGTLFQAVEPKVTAAVLNAAGGTSVDVARLAITARPLGIGYLAALGLLNVPPAQPESPFNDPFNDNYVFRDIAPVQTIVPGAMAIQAAFEAADWLGMLGDPLSYAPHLQSALRLANVPPKSTLFQFGQGDLEVPNPTEFAVISAAGAQSSGWFFLFNKAVASGHPELLGITTPDVAPLPILPHRILANPTILPGGVAAELSIAFAEQQQVAAYLKSNGALNPDPNQYVTSPFSPALQLFQPLVPTSVAGCNGVYYGVFSGNITVSSGQNCTFLGGGVIGNVVQNGGSLTLSGATISGNVQVNGSGTVSVGPYTVITGNLVVQSLSTGPGAQVCGTKIQGNLQVQSNATAVTIGNSASCPGNSIGNDLQVQSNNASTIIFGNFVTGNLQVQSNSGATQVFNNQVGNNLQCQSNSSFTGGGNSAKQKQGQCASF